MQDIPNPSVASASDITRWLGANPSLDALRAFLWANDPNGEYGDSVEFGPLTIEVARDIVTRQLEDLV